MTASAITPEAVARETIDGALEDGMDLPDPDVLAAEIVDDLRAALEEFERIGADLARPSRPA